MDNSLKYLLYDESNFSIAEYSAGEFGSIVEARSGLVVALQLEEDFDNVFVNYLEFEKCFLNFAIDHSFRRFGHYDELHAYRNEADRLAANLLSSCRAYFDHASKSLSGNSDLRGYRVQFDALRSEVYDSNFEYRLAEMLRNITQHASNIVHGIKFPANRLMEVDPSIIEHSAFPYVDLCKLDLSKITSAFREELNTVLDDRKELDSLCDLRHVFRGYFSGIMSVQKGLRELMAAEVSRWDEVFEKIFAKSFIDRESRSMFIMCMNTNNESEGEYPILSRLKERRVRFQQVNDLKYPIVNNYVTNKSLLFA